MDDDTTPNAPRGYVDGPAPISLRDRLLIEWVAQAKVGDPLPPPWSDSQSPLRAVIRTLVLLEVIDRPHPDASLATVAKEASAAACEWLKNNPAPPAAPPPLELLEPPPWADRSARGGSALDIARRQRESAAPDD